METSKIEQSDKEEQAVKLLNTDGNVKLPTVSNVEKQEEEITNLVKKAVQSDSIKRILIEEETHVEQPNYVFDFSEVDSMSVLNKEALRAMLSSKGEVAIYLYKSGKLMKVGYGLENKLASTVNTFKNYILDKEVKVYRNLDEKGNFEEVKSRDISKLRMNI